MVEGTSLENWHGRKSIVGSNPTLSASSLFRCVRQGPLIIKKPHCHGRFLHFYHLPPCALVR